MPRILHLAGAQMGANQRDGSRAQILERMIALLDQAAAAGAQLVVFPELPFTTFFPRWLLERQELDSYFEREFPGPQTQAIFDRAREKGVGLYLGYAELTEGGQRFNTSVTVAPDGSIIGKYRKVHLPGTEQPRDGARFQQLEKRYFEYGDLGFPAFRGPASWGGPILGMLVCNDRRWPEAWRCYGLQAVELMLMGYNSAAYDPLGGESEDQALRTFHSTLAVQANAYMNATWAVSVAKAGVEDGAGLIGGSVIIDPNGRIVAEAKTLGDEIILAEADLDACRQGKEKMFNFAAHRRPDQYRRIVEQVGAIPPG
ncbi:N-carbamoyl-D-amino-acid hydrolase [Plastoroseomonas arctica]|uniref:N-carbamoyl-D-amino-acid hydrolase n=1 Tax=Plastoroseomonas arctica TaxID=1509237 RepID=A0AAF1KJZ4_9PROT|nr:N-carbamoyl-D-amino-acid hydrolase [Plastoroseomonas arctica]MBR0656085.1 N-carbamoyl-D-amino-acid hydrolase [Plastoroseomonas arctica]